MAPNSLYPAYVDIAYHSGYASHHQLVPTLAWNAGIGTFGNGGYVAWDGSSRDADAMIKQLCTAQASLMPDGVEYDTYIIYTLATPTSLPTPVKGGTLAIPGTITTPKWTRAVQRTLTMFDTAFGTMKAVLLDADSNDLFTEIQPGAFSTPEAAWASAFTSDANAWSSRKGFKANIVRSLGTTINTKLRRSYVV